MDLIKYAANLRTLYTFDMVVYKRDTQEGPARSHINFLLAKYFVNYIFACWLSDREIENDSLPN